MLHVPVSKRVPARFEDLHVGCLERALVYVGKERHTLRFTLGACRHPAVVLPEAACAALGVGAGGSDACESAGAELRRIAHHPARRVRHVLNVEWSHHAVARQVVDAFNAVRHRRVLKYGNIEGINHPITVDIAIA